MKPHSRWVRAAPFYKGVQDSRIQDCFVQVAESDGRAMTGPCMGVEGEWLNDRVLALLKRIEWNDEGQFCPACSKLLPGGNPEPGEGHAPDCELAALIRELEGA